MPINTRVLVSYNDIPGGVQLSNDFETRLADWDAFFKGRLSDKINESLGDRWSLKFTETPHHSFIVDITASNDIDCLVLAGFVGKAIPEVQFSYYKFDYQQGYVRLR